MTSIDETAHTMFGMGRMNPMTLLQTMREIKSILDIFKRKADEAADSVGTTGIDDVIFGKRECFRKLRREFVLCFGLGCDPQNGHADI